MKSAIHYDKKYRTVFCAIISLIINFSYGIVNAVIGFITFSWWYIAVGVYYIILSIMRFCLVVSCRKDSENSDNEVFMTKFSGAMFLCLSLTLCITVFLTVKNNVGTKHHEIIMITVATYTFTKLTIAIINFCKCKKINLPIIKNLRNISVADAIVSIFSLQRSMLISFEGKNGDEIRLMNILTGSAVCFVVFILGINLLRKEKKNG